MRRLSTSPVTFLVCLLIAYTQVVAPLYWLAAPHHHGVVIQKGTLVQTHATEATKWEMAVIEEEEEESRLGFKKIFSAPVCLTNHFLTFSSMELLCDEFFSSDSNLFISDGPIYLMQGVFRL